MSLEIFIDEAPKDRELVRDVRLQFAQIKIAPTAATKRLIKEIDQGEYYDNCAFLDRFGVKVYYMGLSEGCKAALCAEYCPDKVIDTIEIGVNAVNEIILALKEGAILLHMPTALGLGTESIDVLCCGYHFINGDDLNHYLMDDYPLPLGYYKGGMK